MTNRTRNIALVSMGFVAMTAIAVPQLDKVLKGAAVVGGVTLASPAINKGINSLAKHTDTFVSTTKVVPIITVGINTAPAAGAAQVMGPKNKVSQVVAVAQPSGELFGHAVRIRALIPVSSKDVVKDIKRVDGVGVSGIVDLKL